jgi:uncharacterized membrane protein YjdF
MAGAGVNRGSGTPGVSGARPYDRATWLMEVLPAIISLPVLWLTYQSATYELIEWGAALALGQGADEFLGTQGDPWDTQSDMFLALIGSVAALALFSRLQDRQIWQLATAKRATS